MMRLIYFLLKVFLQYSLRIYYPRQKLVNPPKRFFGRTIYVCNHASSFMDPLVVGVLQRPIVFFLTRSDVFNRFTKPFFWLAQMLPIFREHDGEDTRGKSKETFDRCRKILSFGRNLLIFGEGFTDDTFIRRLKPIKKGPARIGFDALEALQWKKKIYVAAIGINYSDPKVMGSDLLISTSDRFCLNDYKDAYQENPAKTIVEVTKRIENLMKEQVTHVEDKNWLTFHEQIMRLNRNGLDPVDTDFSIPLKKRWQNSRNLANWINGQNLDENPVFLQLRQELNAYYEELNKKKIEDRYLYELSRGNKMELRKLYVKLILLTPGMLLSLVLFYPPYKWVKQFSERIMKRPVFWSSVKMFLGMLLMALWNMPIIYIVNKFWIHDGWIAFGIYLLLPFIGILGYRWMKLNKELKAKKAIMKFEFTALVSQRNKLHAKVSELVK